MLTGNRKAFADMVAISELGRAVLAGSDDGYNVLVGSIPSRILTFPSYAAHPQIHNRALNSDAAGRYQFMGRYWPAYKTLLNLPDFGKDSQDAWFLQLLRECKALAAVDRGDIGTAIPLCSSRWASLPGNDYGQHQQTFAFLTTAFTGSGGNLNG